MTADVDKDTASAEQLLGLIADLYPLTRSITGDGVRATLARLSDIVDLQIHEVASGTPVFDWTVPDEWNLRAAWIKDPEGRIIVDAQASNLHVVSYSTPVRGRFTLDELRPHLHSSPGHPDWIPYRTSYYNPNWGFCLADRQLQSLQPGDYEVCIDADLGPGSLSYGEVFIPGQSEDEVLLYSHSCHPSLANDNLSGLAVCAYLGRWLAARENRYSYRIVFGPGTIGSLTWMSRNRDALDRIRHGLVIALVGTDTPLQYKRSRAGNAEIDRVAAACVRAADAASVVTDYSPWGYDERQFGSPGFALPVGRLTRAAEEGYPQYHHSADNLELISATALLGTLQQCQRLVEVLESNRVYRNLSPYGEPQLGRRGVYRKVGGSASTDLQRALLWVLSLADGQTDLVAMHERSGVSLALLAEAAEVLAAVDLLATDETV